MTASVSDEVRLGVLQDPSRSVDERVGAAKGLQAAVYLPAAPRAWRLVMDVAAPFDVRLAAIDLVERLTFAGWCLDDDALRAADSLFAGEAYTELTDRWMRLLGTSGSAAALDALFRWAGHAMAGARASALGELVHLDPPERRAQLDAALAAVRLDPDRIAALAARRRVARTWQLVDRRELAPPDFLLELVRRGQLALLARLAYAGCVPKALHGPIRAELLARAPGNERRVRAAILRRLDED